MPELPEVESVVRTLRPIVKGATIVGAMNSVPKMVTPKGRAFTDALIGKTFLSVERIGKFILFFLSDNVVLVSHLRMEGKYIELTDANAKLTRFARFVFTFEDGRRLVYDDMRKFGTFHLATKENYRQLKALQSLGQEPMDVKDVTTIHQPLTRSNRVIKSLLLDQTILLGLGNIYADEVLYACRIHPLTKGKYLTFDQTNQIVKESARILLAAIDAGGTRIRSYQSGAAIDGHFTLNILAYGKDGQPCSRCHHRLDKITVGGRGTHYCPRCQHHPELPLVIGVTGEIATGKSTLLSTAKELGIPSIIADEMVHHLYTQASVIKKIKLLFPELAKEKGLNRRQLLDLMVSDSRRYQALIKWLFPLVKEAILTQLKRVKKPVAIIEVPLLFQSGLDAYCDVIIGVEMPVKKQRSGLSKRQPETAEKLWILNERNRYRDYLGFVDHRLQNDQTLPAWQQKINKILTPYLKLLKR